MKFIKAVKKMFQQVFGYKVSSVSLIKKHFSWFTNTDNSWYELLDILLEITSDEVQAIKDSFKPVATVKKQMTEIELLAKKYNLIFSKRHSIDEDYDIYSNNKYIGRVSLSFISKVWGYSFTSSGFSRRAKSLEGALLMLLNNHTVDVNFSQKSKEYYDLFSA